MHVIHRSAQHARRIKPGESGRPAGLWSYLKDTGLALEPELPFRLSLVQSEPNETRYLHRQFGCERFIGSNASQDGHGTGNMIGSVAQRVIPDAEENSIKHTLVAAAVTTFAGRNFHRQWFAP